jgi:phospholipid/cholesterol/gamma-HCH transport system substrate-binding protein
VAAHVYRKARLLFGTLVLAGAVAGVGWRIWASDQNRIYQIRTRDSVSGLIVDSPVEFHGVDVGKVAKIELVGGTNVNILLSVVKSASVSKATVATITSRGLAARGFTGYAYVALENTGADAGPLTVERGERYPTIPAAPSRIDTMDTTVAEATAKLEVITRILQSLLDDETIASLKRSVSGLQVLSDVLRSTLDENLIASLKTSLQDVDNITRRMRAVLDDKTVADLKRSLEALQEITITFAANNRRLESLITNAERDSRDIRPLVDGTSLTVRELRTQVLPEFYRTIGDLQDLTRSVGGMTKRLARDPSTLVRGTVTPPGPGER